MIIQISFLNEINEGLSDPRKTNLCTFSAEWFSQNRFALIKEKSDISEASLINFPVD